MFLAASRSLSCSVPQLLQSHVLSESITFGLTLPHSEQSFVNGKKRPTLTLCLKRHGALYST